MNIKDRVYEVLPAAYAEVSDRGRLPAETVNALLLAAEMLDGLDGQRRREEGAYAEGYRDGWLAGYEVGEASVFERIAEGGRLARGIADTPELQELVRNRAEPGPAAREWRRRHGGEFTGGAVVKRGGSVVLAVPVPWGPPTEGSGR